MESQKSPISIRQVSRLYTLARKWHWSQDQIHIYIDLAFQVSSVKLLNPTQYESFCKTLTEGPYVKALCYYIFYIEDKVKRANAMQKAIIKEEEIWDQMKLFEDTKKKT